MSEARTTADQLAGALRNLRKAEWMVTHDWGGDRDEVLAAADAALAAYDSAEGQVEYDSQGAYETFKTTLGPMANENSETMGAFFAGFAMAVDQAADRLQQLEQENAKLKAALTEAIEVIHIWHGDGEEWELYYEHSPEMKRMRAALAPHDPAESER